MNNICMIAYSDYNQDARIKSYIRILLKNGFYVDLLALKDGKSRNVEVGNGYRIIRLSNKFRGNNKLLYILSYLKFFLLSFIYINLFDIRKNYSTVHVHNMPNFLVFATLFQRLRGKNIILDNHDLMVPLYETKFKNTKNSLLLFLLKIEQKYSAKYSTAIICADHLQREYLSNNFGISLEKINVSLNLPHEDIFKYVSVNKDKTCFNIIYHGTIAKRLGIDIMIKAVKEIQNQIPIKFHIYGSGDYLKEVIALRDYLGLKKEVYIAGHGVPTEDLPGIICSMDAGMIGNRRTESTARFMFPVKLLEYIYLRIPVIVPKLEIIQYYFKEDMLLFYEPENVKELSHQILNLYKNENIREVIREKSFKFFDKYNLSGKTEDYLKIIK